jgi:hypothetical protein
MAAAVLNDTNTTIISEINNDIVLTSALGFFLRRRHAMFALRGP